ncbi:MAG: hypothetical protein ACM3Q2_03660, partial [Syntrophothermus sp.]
MITFFLFLAVVFMAFWVFRVNEKNAKLQRRIEALERWAANFYSSEKPVNEAPPVKSAGIERPQEKEALSGVFDAAQQISPDIPAHTAEKEYTPETKVPPAYVQILNKFEKQIVENWTGILGAVIMVAGISFLGIYAAFRMTPFFRFLMIIASSVITAGLFFYLKSKPKWIKLALWLRSSAGAIFLFACLGAGGFEGLKWIDDPLSALLLLISGILVNLYLSYAGGKQVFASLHVVLSLLALSIAPQNNLTFIIGTLITLFGIGLTYREKWDYHLLLTITGYFVYHLYWFFSIKGTGYSLLENITGIISIIAAGIMCVLVHYRKTYRSGRFSLLPFSVHLLNWIYTGIGLLYHTTGSRWKTLYIFAASIAVFFLARTAKKNSVKWLYITDTITSLLMAVTAVITLYKWELNTAAILGIIFLLLLLFLVIMIIENEDLLFRIGSHIAQAAGLVLIINAIAALDYHQYEPMVRQAIILIVCSICAAAFHLFSLKRNREDLIFSGGSYNRAGISVIAILAGLMPLAAYLVLADYYLSEYLILILIPFLYVRQRWQSLSFGAGIFLLMTGMNLVYWGHIVEIQQQLFYRKLISVIPVITVSFAGIFWSYSEYHKKHLRQTGVYLLSFNLMVSGYYLLNNISVYLTGIWWLILGLLLFETAALLNRKPSETADPGQHPGSGSGAGRYFLHGAYSIAAAFVIRYFLVDIFYHDMLWTFRIRFLTGILAIAVFIYLLLRPSIEGAVTYKSRQYLHPLFAELTLLFIYTLGLQEVSDYLFAFVLVIMAIILLFLGIKYSRDFSRLRFYSLIFCWMSALQVIIYSLDNSYGYHVWYRVPKISGGIAVFFQLCYLTYFYIRNNAEAISFPPSLTWFSVLINKTGKYLGKLAFYPVIITTALFLYLAFDKSVLTLLWVAEAFIIFILSIVLKERYFRYSALLLIAISIFRLVFYDLSYADAITRAFVFLG